MNALGNLLWIIFGGLIASILWAIAGLLLCITVIGIPFGLQCFKIAGFILSPFGRDIKVTKFGAVSTLANIIWILLLGWELCLTHLVLALLLGITIVGIPFAKQHLKLAYLALMPFGSEIY